MLVSAIEHYSYCPRQFALIHLEGIFEENVFTLRGHEVHERVDEPQTRFERGVRVERALPIWSEEHGLLGRADVVEFVAGKPVPIEYKSGTTKEHLHAQAQLCAQALCLEEMFGERIETGFLFFSASHERIPVQFTPALRERTVEIISQIRKLLAVPQNPPPANDKRCVDCSLREACQPGALANSLENATRLFDKKPEAELP